MTEPGALSVRFGADGLAPVVVQDAVTGDVLMMATMNEDALRLTRETGRAHYWSRGRQRLWRKGETSGHEQIVKEIRVNCERNSLLLLVRQLGAVCHDGYPTCYYRRLEPDGPLTVVRERAFDPAEVYGIAAPSSANAGGEAVDLLAEATRRQYGAYAFLRDHPLEEESGTSRRLRGAEELASRLGDELGELAGVLEGRHHHHDFASDLRLEASQVIYWLLLLALRNRLTWAAVRPDRALATADGEVPPGTIASLLRAAARRWAGSETGETDFAAHIHGTLALVGQACHSGGVDPLTAVQADLAALATRPYLGPYFAGLPRRDEATA